MKKFSVKSVVAIGIGAALFFVLGRYVSIPSPVPNTYISLQYAILGVFAAIYGPVVGGLIGLVGHTLIDLSFGGAPWWSWVIASGVAGCVAGLVANKVRLYDGKFGKTEIIRYTIASLIAQIVAFIVVAPALDILIYAEPANRVFAQGAMAAASNFIIMAVVGTILLVLYANTFAKKGSLTKE